MSRFILLGWRPAPFPRLFATTADRPRIRNASSFFLTIDTQNHQWLNPMLSTEAQSTPELERTSEIRHQYDLSQYYNKCGRRISSFWTLPQIASLCVTAALLSSWQPNLWGPWSSVPAPTACSGTQRDSTKWVTCSQGESSVKKKYFSY